MRHTRCPVRIQLSLAHRNELEDGTFVHHACNFFFFFCNFFTDPVSHTIELMRQALPLNSILTSPEPLKLAKEHQTSTGGEFLSSSAKADGLISRGEIT